LSDEWVLGRHSGLGKAAVDELVREFSDWPRTPCVMSEAYDFSAQQHSPPN
jgi:hypothetical protein